MSWPIVVGLGVLGWFVGAIIWVASTAQADRRALWSGPVCTNCAARLPVLAWLPVCGFGTIRRCPSCETPVARFALRVAFELAVAAYAAFAAWRFDAARPLAETLIFAIPLLIVFLVDWWTRYIHLEVIYAGIAAAVAFALVDGWSGLIDAALSALGAVAVFAFFFLLAALIYRNVRVVPFGIGDVYLAAMIAAMVRYPDVVSALMLGIFLAGFGSVLLLVSRRVSRKDPIPYGPYLCLGALVILLLRSGSG